MRWYHLQLNNKAAAEVRLLGIMVETTRHNATKVNLFSWPLVRHPRGTPLDKIHGDPCTKHDGSGKAVHGAKPNQKCRLFVVMIIGDLVFLLNALGRAAHLELFHVENR